MATGDPLGYPTAGCTRRLLLHNPPRSSDTMNMLHNLKGEDAFHASSTPTVNTSTAAPGSDMPSRGSLQLTMTPVPGRPGVYDATLPCGLCVARSRQPFLDGARALLALGHNGGTTLTASNKGSAIIAQRSTIGEAAKWTIVETDRDGLRRRLWRPAPAHLRSIAIAA